MQKVTLIEVSEILNNNLDWGKIINISQSDSWLLKSDDFFNEKESQDEAYKIASVVKPSNKIFEIYTYNRFLISKLMPDCVVLSSEFELSDVLVALDTCEKYKINVSYRILDSLDASLNEKELNRVIDIGSKFPDVVFLLRVSHTNISWWVENLLGKIPNEIYLHSCPPCLGKKFNLKYTQATIIEIVEKIGFHPTQLFSQVCEMAKVRKCSECKNNKNCMGFLKENKTLPSEIYPLYEKLDYYIVPDSIKKRVVPLDMGYFQIDPDCFKYEETFSNISENEKKIIQDIKIAQDCRNFKSFKGRNYFDFIRFNKPIVFNRVDPELNIPLFTKEDDLWSVNLYHLEYCWTNNKKRVLHSHSFPVGSLYIIGKIYFDDIWALEDQNKINNYIENYLIEYFSKYQKDNFLEKKGMDILYNNYKFYGKQWKFIPDKGLIYESYVLLDKPSPGNLYDIMVPKQEKSYDPKFISLSEIIPDFDSDKFCKDLVEDFKKTFKNYIKED